MFALILGIAAAALWIVFDAAVSVMTYPVMPAWEWWTILLSGAGLAILTATAQILEYKAHEKEEKTHSSKLGAIATGTLAIFERLATLTQTTGQPVDVIIEGATARIDVLSTQLATLKRELEITTWQPIPDNQIVFLIKQFQRNPQEQLIERTVEFLLEDGFPDVARLSEQLHAVFKKADWTIRNVEVARSWDNIVLPGIQIEAKPERQAANLIAESLSTVVGSVSKAIDKSAITPFVLIVIGRKPSQRLRKNEKSN
jgi:hypothetical protein